MLRKILASSTARVYPAARRLRTSSIGGTCMSAPWLSAGQCIVRRRRHHVAVDCRIANVRGLQTYDPTILTRSCRQTSLLRLRCFSTGLGKLSDNGASTGETKDKSLSSAQGETRDAEFSGVDIDVPSVSSMEELAEKFDRAEVETETKRLLQLLDPNCDDTEVIKERSMTNLSEYDCVMEKWMKFHEILEEDGVFAANSAESLLDALEGNYDRLVRAYKDKEAPGKTDDNSGNSNSWELTPNAVSYNFVLHAHATSGGGGEAAKKAQSILERMLQRCRIYTDGYSSNHITGSPPPPPPEPTARSFNSVINAWAKSGEKEAGSKSENVFRMMENWARHCKEYEAKNEGKACYNGTSPNVRTFSGVCDAWANSGMDKLSADRVTTILDLMIERRRVAVAQQQTSTQVSDEVFRDQTTLNVVKPNVIVFNSVINAIAKSGQGKRGAEKTEEVLSKMEALQGSGELGPDDGHKDDDIGLRPNTRTLSLILEAWVKCSDDDVDGAKALKRAEEILSKMEDLYSLGHDVKPNVVSFTQVITALGRCKDIRDAGPRAEAILDRMLDLYQTSRDEELRPNTKTFNATLTAHARSGCPDALQRAQAVWKKLCDFARPDRISYCAFIDAFAKSGDKDAGVKAMELLKEMELDDDIKVDTITYNSVIDALSKSRGLPAAAQQAESLLRKMEQYYADGNSDLKPDSLSYTTTITAVARSQEPRKHEKARDLLNRMIEQNKADNTGVKPDVFAFSSCLNACASTGGDASNRRKALIGAIQLFEEFKKSPDYGRPNQFTYGAMLKASCRLSADQRERDRLLKSIFNQCREAGSVSKSCLAQFERGASRQLMEEVFGPLQRENGGQGGKIIPSSWYRSVRKWDRPV